MTERQEDFRPTRSRWTQRITSFGRKGTPNNAETAVTSVFSRSSMTFCTIMPPYPTSGPTLPPHPINKLRRTHIPAFFPTFAIDAILKSDTKSHDTKAKNRRRKSHGTEERIPVSSSVVDRSPRDHPTSQRPHGSRILRVGVPRLGEYDCGNA